MKDSKVWIGLAACCLLVACSQQADDQTGDDDSAYMETYQAQGLRIVPEDLMTAAHPDLSPAHQDFAFADFRARSPSDENTLSAPFDLQQLLSMVALGADGTTLDAFSTASGFDLADAATYAGLSLWEQQIDGLAAVERQRLLWGQQRYRFAGDYLQVQAELFGPTMSGLDFQFVDAQTTIDAALNGELALTEISARTRLVAAQTTRLALGWSAADSAEALSGRFGPQDGQHWVDMVRIDGLLNVADGDNYHAVEVPFAEAGLSLVMITPAEGAFETVRNGLNRAFWNELRAKLAPAVTTVHVPRLALVRDLSADDMPDLGVALTDGAPVIDGSSPGPLPVIVLDSTGAPIDSTPATGPADPATAANFTKVNNAGFLYLEAPRQHIALTIDGQGLTATTATAAVHTATDYEPRYLIDSPHEGGGGVIIISPGTTQSCFYPPDQRPFLFAIYAGDTATVLHLGQVLALDGPTVAPDWTVPYYSACGDSPPLVDVYQYTGALQCQPDSGIPLAEVAQTLTNAGIEVVDAYESNDGLAHAAVCDTPDGSINVFTIHESQVPLAETLGFARLSELNAASL